MRQSERPDGLVLLCDLQGRIVQVLRDGLGTAAQAAPGQLFPLVVDTASFSKALSFLVELQARGTVFGWELNLPLGDHIRPLLFGGAVAEERLLIVAARTSHSLRRICEELLRIGDSRISAAATAIRSSREPAASEAGQDALYLEFSRLNNELSNLQRELAKRNAELHTLNEKVQQHAEELEERVAERTAELRASEATFRAVFEGAGIGIALIDREGRLAESNPALQEMLLYGVEALRDMDFAELFHDMDGDTALEVLHRDLLSGTRDQYWVEGYCTRKDGQRVYTNLTVAALRGHDGAPDYAVAMVEDVSDRKRAQAAMMRAERLTIAGRLAASLAHEINNPLQSVIGCVGLAQEAVAEGQSTDEYLSLALNELRRLAGMVARMRDLHRPPSSEEKDLIDVNLFLEQVLTLSRRQCEESGVRVEWRPGSDLPALLLAPDQLRQVMLNLILNALDAMPDGGRLLIETAHTAQPEGARISLTDDGVGIAPDVLSHIFEPFYSTKPGGMGIGLFITQDIVRHHGGQIEVESEERKGTTFSVWLPVPSRVA